MEVPRPRELLVAAVALAALTLVCIATIDAPIARWLAGYEALPFWDAGIEALEWAIGLPVFKWLAGVVLGVAMLVCVAVPRWRPWWPAFGLIVLVHVASRFLTLELKLLTDRLRPLEWIAQGGGQWFRDGHAFPSGHVAIFASLVVPLAVVAPRTRPLLAIVAFVMLARLAVSAHYLSDVIGGLALVCFVTYVSAALIAAGHRSRTSRAPA